MMLDHARRMYAEALTRLNDAEVLARSLRTKSDAPHLLSILGFEVLLKCAGHLCNAPPSRSHQYTALWRKLTPTARAEVMAVARDRMPGHADLSDLDRLLSVYEFLFKKARYYYEFNEGLTAAQVRAKAQVAQARRARG